MPQNLVDFLMAETICNKERNNSFDFLIFVFALVVVCGHIIAIANIPALKPYGKFFNTYLSVTGFFIISGFLIAQSYEHSSTIGIYLAKRAKRLLPAYLLVVIGCAIGLVIVSTLSPSEYFFSHDWWAYLGANLTFANFLHPSLPGVFDSALINDTSVNPALWTLKIEVAFYLVLPLIILWLRRSKCTWVPLMVIYLFAVLYKTGLEYVGEHYQLTMATFMARQLPGFLSYFAVGITIYNYSDWFKSHKNRLLLPAVVIYLIESLWLHTEILVPLTYGIIVLWAAWSLPKLNDFAKYGDISYGIYIYHGPVIKIMLTLGLFSSYPLPLAVAITLIIILVCGFLSWHLLEKRILKWGR